MRVVTMAGMDIRCIWAGIDVHISRSDTAGRGLDWTGTAAAYRPLGWKGQAPHPPIGPGDVAPFELEHSAEHFPVMRSYQPAMVPDSNMSRPVSALRAPGLARCSVIEESSHL